MERQAQHGLAPCVGHELPGRKVPGGFAASGLLFHQSQSALRLIEH